jgi:alkaline phosphatase D
MGYSCQNLEFILRSAVLKLLFILLVCPPTLPALEPGQADSSNLVENWDAVRFRPWVGPNLWANRLADWEVRDGYLRPVNGDPRFPVRTVHAVTREVTGKPAGFSLSVKVSSEFSIPSACRVGFLIGTGAGLLNYKAAALVHSSSGKGGGILAFFELGPQPRLTFRDNSDEYSVREYAELSATEIEKQIDFSKGKEYLLKFEALPAEGENNYDLRLLLHDVATGESLAALSLENRPEREILGSFALSFSPLERVSRPSIRLREFRAWGEKLRSHPERSFGPCMGTLYSASGGVLKMTAQFAPVAYQGEPGQRSPAPLKAYLEIKGARSGTQAWQVADSARIAIPDYTARFRVENWSSNIDQAFRVVYPGQNGKKYYYQGTIAAEPKPGSVFSLAAFTGMGVMGRTADSGPAPKDKGPIVGRWTPANIWFPFAETVNNLSAGKVDLLCFTGDQVYEGKPTEPDRADRFPVYDYLYKWYLWHWAFGELTRHRPAICQVDDHDVYQGNVWGWGGKLNMAGSNSSGGYMMDPLFVELVQRTQCAHIPDPYDPTPILNGISVYYTGFSYGGVSFAVLEDRKFKSARTTADSQAVLLGERQLNFVQNWAADWRKATMKVVLSQTIYASAHTDKDGHITKDYDTGGWPKAGRDQAVSAFRKARALIIGGDQHLATLIRLGLETYSNGPVQFCVPAIGNIFWRWFYPRNSGTGPLADPQGYTGDFEDGFGNRFRLLAAANPTDVKFMGDRDQTLRRWNSRPGGNVDSVRLCQGDGVGIVRIDTGKRTCQVECWPYDVMPNPEGKGQFKGWPATFTQQEMDGRETPYYIARVEYPPGKKICAAVFDQIVYELVYCFPLKNPGEPLPVYANGTYDVLLIEPDSPARLPKRFSGLLAVDNPQNARVIKY